MTKLRAATLLVVVACVVVCLGAEEKTASPPEKEPTYQEKPLSYWVAQSKKRGWLADPQRAVRALGKIGTPAVPALKELLNDSDWTIRVSAADALPRNEAKAAVAPLMELLLKGDKRAAAYALGRIGPEAEAAIPPLTALLRHEDWQTRVAAAIALTDIGPAAVPTLMGLLKEKEWQTRRTGAWALGQVGPGATMAVPALMQLLKESEPSLRRTAARALGKIGTEAKAAAPSLAELLKGEHADVRRAKPDDWEITPQSERALQKGLQWLAANQGPEGNWTSDNLALVSMGALAFLSAGHTPRKGQYADNVRRALDYVVSNAESSGLLNIAQQRCEMYNHGLSTFVLAQAYAMTNDPQIRPVLDRALRLIAETQCGDGGWDYGASSVRVGHDLSLAAAQIHALHSAGDIAFEAPPEMIDAAIRSVREHYMPKGRVYKRPPTAAEEMEMRKLPGQFVYSKGGPGTLAMAAAGVVCVHDFGHDDWRINKNMQVIEEAIRQAAEKGKVQRSTPLNAYTLYYVGLALHQVGGKPWQQSYPLLRDMLVESLVRGPDAEPDAVVSGKPGKLYLTSVACLVLAMPHRRLPILQQ